ncbi:hypothetical protein BDV09DRAFT_178869 [Aspergillus tetrazonus]
MLMLQIHHATEDERRPASAQRVDDYDVRNSLAENVEDDKELHANTQVLESHTILWLQHKADSAYFIIFTKRVGKNLLSQQNSDDPHGHITYYAA